MSRRSGSRWDDQDRQRQRGGYNDYKQKRPPVKPHAISDEDAMKALMFSAESRAKEREGEIRAYSERHRRNRRDGDRHNKGRRGDKGSKETNSSEVSYYGPGGSSGGSNENSSRDNDDRKRKRFSDRDRQVDDSSRRRGGDRSDRYLVEDDKDDRNSKKGDKSNNADDEEEKPPPEFKPNFGLSGVLAEDTETGNVYKGVVLKFKEPPEARAPNTQWRFYVFKPKPKGSGDSKNSGDDKNNLVETLHISKQSAYLLGRNAEIADIPLLHPSLSSQHAVLQYRAVPVPSDKIGAPPRLSCQPYIMDLESTNGTFLNGVRVDAARYYQLKRGDLLTFGASTREYVLLTENTTSMN